MLSPREKFSILVSNIEVGKVDVLILLEGDGLGRIPYAIELLQKKVSDKLIFSGGIENLTYGSYPFEKCSFLFEEAKIGSEKIIKELVSQNTQEQAVETLKICKELKVSKIGIIASHYHIFRSYLTFLKVWKNSLKGFSIYPFPVRNLSWTDENVWGSRSSLLEQEFEKISHYQSLGDVESFENAVEYLLSLN